MWHYVVPLLWTHTLEWYGIICNEDRRGSDTCYYEIGLCAQHINQIMDSIVYTIGIASLITETERIFTLTT